MRQPDTSLLWESYTFLGFDRLSRFFSPALPLPNCSSPMDEGSDRDDAIDELVRHFNLAAE
jgi:hypothetical protein